MEAGGVRLAARQPIKKTPPRRVASPCFKANPFPCAGITQIRFIGSTAEAVLSACPQAPLTVTDRKFELSQGAFTRPSTFFLCREPALFTIKFYRRAGRLSKMLRCLTFSSAHIHNGSIQKRRVRRRSRRRQFCKIAVKFLRIHSNSHEIFIFLLISDAIMPAKALSEPESMFFSSFAHERDRRQLDP